MFILKQKKIEMSQKCLKMMITPNSFFLPFQYIPNSKTKLEWIRDLFLTHLLGVLQINLYFVANIAC